MAKSQLPGASIRDGKWIANSGDFLPTICLASRPRFKRPAVPRIQASSDHIVKSISSAAPLHSSEIHFLKLIGGAFKTLGSTEVQGHVVLQNEAHEEGKRVTLLLLSDKISPDNRLEVSSEATVSTFGSSHQDGDIEYKVKFMLKKDFGEPGAVIVKNEDSKPILLKSIVLKYPDGRSIVFSCGGCVYRQQQRVFFADKLYLPLDTPSGLMRLRKQELANIRGSRAGIRTKGERIYDYDVYNDLGNPDVSLELLRPVLGGSNDFPYPRRCRTGRLPTKTDLKFESPASGEHGMYIPEDEAAAIPKADDSMGALYQLIPEIHKAYASRPSFDCLNELKSVFFEGFNLRPDDEETSILNFPLPQVIGTYCDAWMMDSEFARQAIAGLNPIAIELLKEYPPRSHLEPLRKSSLTEEHIAYQLEELTVQEALEADRLFVLDYHDAYMPFLSKINSQEGVRAYASRTVFFLTKAGTLKPVAIELTTETSAVSRVLLPPASDEKDWLWELAKVHASTNDAAYHQAVSHWLRTHAVLEPFVISTHRHLSDVHPVKALLFPHFKSTLGINSEARRLLICAGGIIERAFFTGKFTLEVSSHYYKNSWRFDEQGLPADLLKRGMAVRNPCSKHGLKLTIDDYPYAVDGLEIWSSLESWVNDYIDIFYKYDVSVCADTELQSWWQEIVEVGHADKRDGWRELKDKPTLKEIITTVLWLASAHHAAVNFGQYAYAGYTPNRPTITHRFVPEAGSDEYRELLDNPEKFFCSTLANRMETVTLLCAIELLSSHFPGQVFLGDLPDTKWTSDDRVVQAFNRFSQRLHQVEEDIEMRNKDPRLINRRGPANVQFTLLCPSSELGLTGRGVPNSVSI